MPGAVLSARIRGGVEKCAQHVGLPLQTWMVCNHVVDGDDDDDDMMLMMMMFLGAKCVGTRAPTNASHNPTRIGDGQ